MDRSDDFDDNMNQDNPTSLNDLLHTVQDMRDYLTRCSSEDQQKHDELTQRQEVIDRMLAAVSSIPSFVSHTSSPPRQFTTEDLSDYPEQPPPETEHVPLTPEQAPIEYSPRSDYLEGVQQNNEDENTPQEEESPPRYYEQLLASGAHLQSQTATPRKSPSKTPLSSKQGTPNDSRKRKQGDRNWRKDPLMISYLQRSDPSLTSIEQGRVSELEGKMKQFAAKSEDNEDGWDSPRSAFTSPIKSVHSLSMPDEPEPSRKHRKRDKDAPPKEKPFVNTPPIYRSGGLLEDVEEDDSADPEPIKQFDLLVQEQRQILKLNDSQRHYQRKRSEGSRSPIFPRHARKNKQTQSSSDLPTPTTPEKAEALQSKYHHSSHVYFASAPSQSTDSPVQLVSRHQPLADIQEESESKDILETTTKDNETIDEGDETEMIRQMSIRDENDLGMTTNTLNGGFVIDAEDTTHDSTHQIVDSMRHRDSLGRAATAPNPTPHEVNPSALSQHKTLYNDTHFTIEDEPQPTNVDDEGAFLNYENIHSPNEEHEAEPSTEKPTLSKSHPTLPTLHSEGSQKSERERPISDTFTPIDPLNSTMPNIPVEQKPTSHHLASTYSASSSRSSTISKPKPLAQTQPAIHSTPSIPPTMQPNDAHFQPEQARTVTFAQNDDQVFVQSSPSATSQPSSFTKTSKDSKLINDNMLTEAAAMWNDEPHSESDDERSDDRKVAMQAAVLRGCGVLKGNVFLRRDQTRENTAMSGTGIEGDETFTSKTKRKPMVPPKSENVFKHPPTILDALGQEMIREYMEAKEEKEQTAQIDDETVQPDEHAEQYDQQQFYAAGIVVEDEPKKRSERMAWLDDDKTQRVIDEEVLQVFERRVKQEKEKEKTLKTIEATRRSGTKNMTFQSARNTQKVTPNRQTRMMGTSALTPTPKKKKLNSSTPLQSSFVLHLTRPETRTSCGHNPPPFSPAKYCRLESVQKKRMEHTAHTLAMLAAGATPEDLALNECTNTRSQNDQIVNSIQ
ncbi:hypothetical protein BLNAU_13147 [Blattamonas nauphoetae]|uniref:Uncharacterized protein n=1 Tax=Blattamonas nauphoetae TaxID=2049346 RepID=A0ABQ9XNT9_9EUKA|nr:hypothetical protein BLNAU_13147 [Blattamonas nauphoetae]